MCDRLYVRGRQKSHLNINRKIKRTTAGTWGDHRRGLFLPQRARRCRRLVKEVHYTFPAKGSNHQQMRNDKNAGEVFKEMYRGIEYGEKFKLVER